MVLRSGTRNFPGPGTGFNRLKPLTSRPHGRKIDLAAAPALLSAYHLGEAMDARLASGGRLA